jgi:hypothetical protein
MKKNLIVLSVMMILISCRKEDNTMPPPPDNRPHPVMLYKDLGSASAGYGHLQALDIDSDGINDFYFSAQLVGDPILQRDRLQFYANSRERRNLLNDVNDQSPMLNLMDPISKVYPGYTWYEISSIVLAEKIITDSGTSWEGRWKTANHNFLPVQIQKDRKLYHGWIELSFDMSNEVVILHRSALSTEADREVKAGY